MHQYLRNEYMKRLYAFNVNMITHHDFGGIINNQVMARNLFTHGKLEFENFDNIIFAYGRVPNVELFNELKPLNKEIYQIGDCLAPRTIEEATSEGLSTVLNLKEVYVNS